MKRLLIILSMILVPFILQAQNYNIRFIRLPNGEARAMHGNDSTWIAPDFAHRAGITDLVQPATLGMTADTIVVFHNRGLYYIVNGMSSYPNYYVSSDGDDANAGTTALLPWKTMEKLQYEVTNNIANGKVIAFRAGDEFVGNINLASKTGITLTRYGNGTNPTLTGMLDISGGWARKSATVANIYRKAVNSTTVKYLTINGQQYQKGKYPKSGYWFMKDNTDYNVDYFFSDSLTQANDYWNGAEVVFRLNAFWYQTLTVSDYVLSTHKLSVSTSAIYPFLDNPDYITGFFFQNNIHCLTQNGDWMYNNDSIYLYYTADPDLLKIEASTYDNAIATTYGATNLTVNGLNITGYNNDAIHNVGGTGFQILNNDISYCLRGVYLYDGATNYTIKNNTIENVALFGVYGDTHANYGTIEQNKITNIGLNVGYDVGGEGLIGIFLQQSDSIIIRKNDVNMTGYSGINTTVCDRFHVWQNRVRNFCQLADDGGGIYSYWGSRSHVTGYHRGSWKYNFVEGSDSSSVMMWASMRRNKNFPSFKIGLYCDGVNEFMAIDSNLSVNNSRNFLWNSLRKSSIVGNWTTKAWVSRDNGGVELEVYDAGPDVDSNYVAYNRFITNYVGTTTAGVWPMLRNPYTIIKTNNTFDYNAWLTPTLNIGAPTYNGIIMAGGGTNYTLAQWKTYLGGSHETTDVKSWSSALTHTSRADFVTYDYNFSSVARLYHMETGWTYYEPTTGAEVTSLTLAPYTGHILYRINDLDI